MKLSEFKRFLAKQGVEFVEGSKHTKLFLNGKQTTLPRHHGKEIGKGLQNTILKQLGIK